MGRMLEALKRTEEAKFMPEPVPPTVRQEPPREDHSEEEMPFVEVGGPRKQAEPKPRMEVPTLRPAVLQLRPPLSVELHPSPQPAAARPRVATELIAHHQPEHPVSRQYADLFTQINEEAADGNVPIIAFTALAHGAGQTTALLNLGVSGAVKHGKKIAIVDANHARPAAAARLGAVGAAGLAEVLSGKCALEQALQATPIKNLHVLAAGHAEPEIASADAVRWLLSWLKQRFDLVLVDAPPWDTGPAIRSFLPATTAVYIVLDAAEKDRPEVRAITRDVARFGSRLSGLIVTQ